MSRVAKHRDQAFIRQHGRCCYCKRFLLPTNARNPLRSTAEHLIARCDGGRDNRDNIAAACWECNDNRHRAKRPLPPGRFKAKRLRWAAKLRSARAGTGPG